MLLEWILALFVLTQVCYFVVNLAMAVFVFYHSNDDIDTEEMSLLAELVAVGTDGGGDSHPRPTEGDRTGAVDVAQTGEARGRKLPDVHVLIPVYREHPEILIETLENVFGQTYPTERLHAFIIYEDDDPTVPALLEAVGDWMDGTTDVTTVAVDHDVLEFDQAPGKWVLGGHQVSRTKAAALTYAFSVLPFDSRDVITVFDSDTLVPEDTFALGVAMLESNDIVQAKQTVRNIDDGLLALLESMGIAAWSGIAYARATNGPYQLLGKGYFLEAGTLYDIGKWQIDAATEDMTLGLTAYSKGYTLGIIDRYIQDTCPSRYRDWVRQKRRWVRGPYEYVSVDGWSLRARMQFLTATIANQSISLINVVGLPVGALVLWLTLTGNPPSLHTGIWVLVVFNGIVWIYYSLLTYLTVREAVIFESRRQKLRYYLISNPITQAVYATLWAVPIVLAMADHLRGKRATFEVTPKG